MADQKQPSADQEAESQDGNGLGWFRRMKEGITTKTAEKKEIPEGNWYKCHSCKTVIASQEHEQNLWVCPNCDHHERIGSVQYFSLLFDGGKFRELQAKMTSANPLEFKDTKDYEDRLKSSMAKTGLKDAIRTGVGEVGGRQMVISSMDFSFIGGSMGSVVGEKIARAIDYAIKNGLPYVCVTKSGGARMMEAGLSLMQMAKTSARLSLLSKAGLPYICILTDPTTGGVTASYAMLGDLHIAEPNALIGFAGPRVVKETIGKDLPTGFQKSEFLLEHGFVDRIVHRKDLRSELSSLIGMLTD
ncbi:MAG: acetyl-CoA carboxylase carboxyl transferase subunit beta [Crocinitomicaceae bacterium]|nr:acetyl-CoA carboxylase carboxyl transferase subunit beta [Crocinitomicaceae bacterium]